MWIRWGGGHRARPLPRLSQELDIRIRRLPVRMGPAWEQHGGANAPTLARAFRPASIFVGSANLGSRPQTSRWWTSIGRIALLGENPRRWKRF